MKEWFKAAGIRAIFRCADLRDDLFSIFVFLINCPQSIHDVLIQFFDHRTVMRRCKLRKFYRMSVQFRMYCIRQGRILRCIIYRFGCIFLCCTANQAQTASNRRKHHNQFSLF